MGKKLYLCSSLVYDVEYVESEKVHFAHKIPILDLEEKNPKKYTFRTGNRGNQETPQKDGRRVKRNHIGSIPEMLCFRLGRKV